MRFSAADLLPILLLAGAFAPVRGEAKEAELAIREAVAKKAGVSVGDVELGGLGFADGTVTDRNWSVELPSYGQEYGKLPVNLAATVDGHSLKYRVSPDVWIWREVPVAAKATKPGGAVSIEMRRVRSDSLRGETPVDATKAWEASTTLALGQPVTTLRVRPVPDRREGDGVTLVVERGPVRISAPGTLLGDAFVGQSVAVTNEVTHAVVHGQFLDDGLVHVGGTR